MRPTLERRRDAGLAVGGFVHLVAERFQQRAQRLACVDVVLDDEQPPLAEPATRATGLPPGCSERRAATRKRKNEDAAAVDAAALRFDGAAVQLREPANERQPQSEAARTAIQPLLPLRKRFEYIRQEIRPNPEPFILDPQLGDRADIAHGHANTLAGRRVLQRVADQVLDDLRDTHRVRFDPHSFERQLEPVWIEADPVRVTEIVENLVGNALKHTPAGRRIRVKVRAVGATAELSVEDEGFGIRAELLPNVFEPFIQGRQGLERSEGGLGIGLTLVRRLTELHGGSVEAHSGGVDRGSVFVVRLPRRTAVASAPATDGQPQPTPDRGRRLLIVEDNDDGRQTLRTLLEMLGHEVHEAADGAAGVAAALELQPDVCFIDIGLPELDGYEVARRVKAAKPGMRLVALTGYGRFEDLERARDAGFDEHLLKPASMDLLQAAINRA